MPRSSRGVRVLQKNAAAKHGLLRWHAKKVTSFTHVRVPSELASPAAAPPVHDHGDDDLRTRPAWPPPRRRAPLAPPSLLRPMRSRPRGPPRAAVRRGRRHGGDGVARPRLGGLPSPFLRLGSRAAPPSLDPVRRRITVAAVTVRRRASLFGFCVTSRLVSIADQKERGSRLSTFDTVNVVHRRNAKSKMVHRG